MQCAICKHETGSEAMTFCSQRCQEEYCHAIENEYRHHNNMAYYHTYNTDTRMYTDLVCGRCRW